MSQQETVEAVERFKSWWGIVLVATDVMSRRLDNLDVDVVINYDCPPEPEDYLYRANHSAGSRNRSVITMFIEGTGGMAGHLGSGIGKRLEADLDSIMGRYGANQQGAGPLLVANAQGMERRRGNRNRSKCGSDEAERRY